MKLLGFNKVLCLSPHPDDVEFSISGTIMKYKDTNFDVLFMSNGTQADITSTNERFNECGEFWDELALKNVTFHKSAEKTLYNRCNFDNTNESEWIGQIEGLFDLKEYDAILGPCNYDSHYEHLITNRIMIALGRNRPISIIEYKSPSTLHDWVPNLFVSVFMQIDVKVSTLRKSFISQLDSTYFSEGNLYMFHKGFNSRKKGIDYIEQFKIKTHYELR
jgi:LmbE family N-acetylglucosaminyl deacetylase